MKQNKLRVGIAGYGVVGKRRRQFIDLHPELQTVAVCDQYFNEPDKIEDGLIVFPDYKQLLEVPLDILFVCLPNYLAAEVTIAGLRRGLHIFCEKPPGRDICDVKRVIDVENKHPKQLLKYGFNHRYHDSVCEALRIIKSGELGEIVNLRGIYGKSKIHSVTSGWRAERRYSGGGILLDQGIHMIDLMQLFCGDFVEVKSFVSNSHWNLDVEDNAYALMCDKQGRVAMLHSSATQWEHRFLLDIALTDGSLELRGILTSSKSYGQEKLVIFRRDESDRGAQREETMTYLLDNSWKNEIFEFADSVLNGSIIKNGSSAEALATMKMVYRIYWSDPEWRKKYNIEDPDSF